MYICEKYESLKVHETNGSHSEFPLRPGPNKELFTVDINCVRICCDGSVVVCDEADHLAKYSKEGEFEWGISIDPPEDDIPYFQKFCLDCNGLIYLPQTGRVKVYSPNGVFSHEIVLESDSDCRGIAVDGDKNIHLGNFGSSIKVFNTEGKLIRQYGHDGLGEVEIIAISEGKPQLVVAAGSGTELFVFNSTGSFLYTVTIVAYISDITFGPDNSLWIAEQAYKAVVRVPKLFHQLPPPLSYLCELSILPHLNELPVSLLPPRLAGLFEKWTDLATVEVRRKSFNGQPSKSKLLSETIELKVEPSCLGMVQWLVSKKMGIEFSAISISCCREDHFVAQC